MVQKLIETLKTIQQVLLAMAAFEPVFLELAKDSNGNRVIHTLLTYLPYPCNEVFMFLLSMNFQLIDLLLLHLYASNCQSTFFLNLACLWIFFLQFIFNAAAKHCVRMAMHQHGCCLLQRCIDHSGVAHKAKILTQIAGHAFSLALDPFG